MPSQNINLNGIHQLTFPIGISSATTASGITTINLETGSNTHDEPLTDGNANFIFAATLTTGGDIIVVIGVPN